MSIGSLINWIEEKIDTPIPFLLLCSGYFFHKSWIAQLTNGYYPEGERVGTILGYIDGSLPNDYYSSLFYLYHKYTQFLYPFFDRLIHYLGYDFAISPEFRVLLLLRILGAFFSLLSIILVFSSAKKIFDKRTAWISSLLLVITPIFAVGSQTGIHHHQVIFFTSLSYFALISFFSELNDQKIYLKTFFVGVTLALLLSITYYGVLFLTPLIVAVFVRLRKSLMPIKILSVLSASFLIAFLVFSSYVLFHPSWYILNIFYGFFFNIASKSNGPIMASWDFFSKMFPSAFGYGIVFSVFFIFGYILFNRKNMTGLHKLHFIFTSFYAIPIILGGTRSDPARQSLILVFIAITSGYGIKKFIDLFDNKVLKIIFITVLIFYQSASCWAWLNVKLQSPYQEVLKYLNQESKNHFSVLSARSDFFSNNVLSIKDIKTFDWSLIDEQSSSIDRFLRIPFDYAVLENFEYAEKKQDLRVRSFYKQLGIHIQGFPDHLMIKKVFYPTVSFCGISFFPKIQEQWLVNMPILSLIENHFTEKQNQLAQNIKSAPQQPVALVRTYSDYSSGIFSLQSLSKKVRDLNIKVWIPTDTLVKKVNFDFLGTKKSFESPSIYTHGSEIYLKDLVDLQISNNDIIIVSGFELNPNYYWTGNPLLCNLELHDTNRQLLFFGLQGKTHLNTFDLSDLAGQLSSSIELEQRLIDTALSENLLVFWANPESEISAFKVIIDFAHFYTEPYSYALNQTQNYNGFAALNDANTMIKSGQLWDKLLLQYCQGKREKPVFVVGESLFGKQGKTSQNENPYIFTVLNYPVKTEQEVLKTIQQGDCYALRSGIDNSLIWLKNFNIQSKGNQKFLNLSVNAPNQDLWVKIIVNGKNVKSFNYKGSFEINENIENLIDLKLSGSNKNSYCRVVVSNRFQAKVVSNPIFY